MQKFKIALSFSGEHRPFVEQVADFLAESVGRDCVLYDKYYEAEFARPDLDTYLQRLYHDDSELIAVFLCADYERKEWCGLEWRAIRDLIKKRQPAAVMPFRFDNTEIPGLFSVDGYVWLGDGRSPKEAADLILKRYALNAGAGPTQAEPPPKRGFTGRDRSKPDKDKVFWTPTPIESLWKASSAFFKQYQLHKAEKLAETYLRDKYKLPEPEEWYSTVSSYTGILRHYGLGVSWCSVIIQTYDSLLSQESADTANSRELCADFAMLIGVVHRNFACRGVQFYKQMVKMMEGETYWNLMKLARGRGDQQALRLVQARLRGKLGPLRDTAKKSVEEHLALSENDRDFYGRR